MVYQQRNFKKTHINSIQGKIKNFSALFHPQRQIETVEQCYTHRHIRQHTKQHPSTCLIYQVWQYNIPQFPWSLDDQFFWTPTAQKHSLHMTRHDVQVL